MMWWGDGYMMGGWIIGGFVLLLVIAAVVAIVLATTRTRAPFQPGMGQGMPGTTPRQILDERYAKGELTTEEYKERIKTLG